jgi:CRP/FNR family transcriptional regulator, cyclic AMP receptor protein
MNSNFDIESLRSIPLLSGLKKAELEKLALVFEDRFVPKGQKVLSSNEPGHFLMFVTSGQVKAMLSDRSGREVVLEFLGAGDFFGELALLTGEARSADIQATEDSSLLVLSKQDFETHLLHNSELALALLREIAQRLRKTSAKVADFALLDVHRRLMRVLESLAREDTDKDGKKIRVIDRCPAHRELAGLIGTTREMVTRVMSDLKLAGRIRAEKKKVIIPWQPVLS